ncbi:MAG: DUF2892 domain-containing protein [Anaerolineae bacterium]|nr:DUF2892 domain-containing protein [Anaerolineae bacterium]
MSEQNQSNPTAMVNVTQNERTISLVGGSVLTVFGVVIAITRRNPVGILVALLGGGLVYQGTTGHSPLYRLMGSNRAVRTNPQNVSVPHEQGEHIVAVVTIDKPIEELYSIWRNFENLPNIMSYLDSVKIVDDTHSRWTVKAPAGMMVSWDAEVINEVKNQVIGWRSLDNAQVANAGSVRFRPAPYGKGTELRVTLEYVAPGQKLGVAVAKWLGQNPEQQLQDDLDRFKLYIESGSFIPYPLEKPAPAASTHTDEGQFRVQDEVQYNEAQEPEAPAADDLNHNMPG